MDKTKDELLEIMRQHRVTSVVLGYNGSGDEGFMDDPEYHGPEDLDVPTAVEKELLEHWDAFHQRVLEAAGWDGYWNGEGGNGTITLDVATGKVIKRTEPGLVLRMKRAAGLRLGGHIVALAISSRNLSVSFRIAPEA